MADNATDLLNSLLRGELAATETYQQALPKLEGTPGYEELRCIHKEHREAANTLRQHVHKVEGRPDQGSGTWSAFAKAVEGTAKAFGVDAALKALKEGEEHGIKEYEEALDDGLLPECRNLVETHVVAPDAGAYFHFGPAYGRACETPCSCRSASAAPFGPGDARLRLQQPG